MPSLFDISIKKAEKLAKIGDFVAAQTAVGELLEKYPGNPRAKALESRIERHSSKHQESSLGLDQTTINELEFLNNSHQWMNLIQRCLELIEHDKRLHLVWNFLGLAQQGVDLPFKAEKSFIKAIEINPTFSAAYSNLGNTLKGVGRLAESEAAYRQAASLNPSVSYYQNNLGAVLEDLGRHQEAQDCFKKALTKDPGYVTAEYNLGGMELRLKQFSDGWRHRECRWLRDDENKQKPLNSSKPLWDGSFVDRLYVWAEQGIGDEVMFGSCFEDLNLRCRELLISCTDRLLPLFEQSFAKEIKFIDRNIGFDESNYDFHAPMMTAAGLVRQNIDEFNSKGSQFLRANSKFTEVIRAGLKKNSQGRPIIGISWLSNNGQAGKQRSIPLLDLVSNIPDDFYLLNLQYGKVATQIHEVERISNRGICCFENIDNWSQLDLFAALIMACDEVISIDNSTVHFAGALGKKCNVLLPFASDWRWGLPGEKNSYWYESLRLHWQTKPGEWKGAFDSLSQIFIQN